MIAVRSGYANPFRELRSHYVTRFTHAGDQVDAGPMPACWRCRDIQSASSRHLNMAYGVPVCGGSVRALLRRASERDQRCRWSPATGRRIKDSGACYLSGESISTVTLTSRILASTLPRNPGGTSS